MAQGPELVVVAAQFENQAACEYGEIVIAGYRLLMGDIFLGAEGARPGEPLADTGARFLGADAGLHLIDVVAKADDGIGKGAGAACRGVGGLGC